MLLASLFSQLVGMRVPGVLALYLGQDLTFRRPVLVGEMVRAKARVTSKSDATRTIVLATEIHGADGKIAVAGTARVKVREAEIEASIGQENAICIEDARNSGIGGNRDRRIGSHRSGDSAHTGTSRRRGRRKLSQ